MLRFVLDPDGQVTPDLRRRLPGRGVWVDATRASVQSAVGRRAFLRGFKAQCTAPDSLADDVDALLARAALARLALAQKAGLVTAGFEKVRAALVSGTVVAVVFASDAADDGRSKVEALAKKAANLHNYRELVDVFSSAELGGTLGRERVVHAALAPGRLSELFILDAERLRVYRNGATHVVTQPDQPDERVFAGPLAV